MRVLLVSALLAACASAPAPAPIAPAAPSAPAAPIVAAPPAPPAPRAPDPDLHRPPPRRALDIDWATVHLATEADALALWQRIAPTGADWDDKLEEVPAALARPLAVALLRGGNFACAAPPTGDCARPLYDEPAPAASDGLAAPCLRRLLALWALAQVEDDDVPAIHDALFAIAALPPPESQLGVAAIHAIPEAAQDDRLAILDVAWRAGQREIVEAFVGKLDGAHLVEAVRRHIASALELLAVADHRALYLAAITDEALPARSRGMAISELAGDPRLPADVTAALVAAAKGKDCQVAAAAARALAQHGDARFVPRKPGATSVPALMRAVCVLASYQILQAADEPSLLATYLPARGLERMTITYDALSETDPDGDGDPHTTHTGELVDRADAVLPEVEDLVRAFHHCAGTICVSDDHEFRFVWKSGQLTRLELADRPPCGDGKPPSP